MAKKGHVPWNKGKKIEKKPTIKKHHYNDGVNNIVAETCPEGFTEGWIKMSDDKKDCVVNKRKKTCLEKHGSETYNNPDKNKQTCLEKYGATTYLHSDEGKEVIDNTLREKYGDNFRKYLWELGIKSLAEKEGLDPDTISNVSQIPSVRSKIINTNLERYGFESYLSIAYEDAQSDEARSKRYKTMKDNNSFNRSNPEDLYYHFLLLYFDEDDIVRQYKDDRYPFSCDFYIKSEDLFIEYNGTWTHNDHAYNENDPADLERKLFLEEKAKESDYYKNALETWTIRDVNKARVAKENNLNYLVIYPNQNNFNIEDEK